MDGVQLSTSSGNWTITLDTSRDVVQIAGTNQFEIPIIVTLPAVQPAASVTINAALLAGTFSYTGPTSGGTQGGQVDDSRGNLADTNDRTFVDITFSPSLGAVLDATSIKDNGGGLGDEFTFGGLGGSGLAQSNDSVKVIELGGGAFRFLLEGDFMPGDVLVTFIADKWSDNSPRGPPGNLGFTQRFNVVGATADLVRTLPAHGDVPETIVALGGGEVGNDFINSRGYIEVTFRGASGNTVDNATINGGEVELRDADGHLIPLGATPIRVGLTNTYRYSFSGSLAPGKYTVTFVAGSFSDSGGVANQAETEDFTVELANAAIADPVPGTTVSREDLNSRGWIDVTFADLDGQSVDPDTILDDGAELTLSSSSGDTITVGGAPVLVAGTVATYRYFFTGYRSGTLSVTFLAGSWTDTAGNGVTPAQIAATPHAATTEALSGLPGAPTSTSPTRRRTTPRSTRRRSSTAAPSSRSPAAAARTSSPPASSRSTPRRSGTSTAATGTRAP